MSFVYNWHTRRQFVWRRSWNCWVVLSYGRSDGKQICACEEKPFSTCIRPYFSFNARILSTILLSSNIRLTVRSKTFCMDIPTSQSVTQISCFSGPASFFHFAICNTVVKFSVLNQIVNDSLFWLLYHNQILFGWCLISPLNTFWLPQFLYHLKSSTINIST